MLEGKQKGSPERDIADRVKGNMWTAGWSSKNGGKPGVNIITSKIGTNQRIDEQFVGKGVLRDSSVNDKPEVVAGDAPTRSIVVMSEPEIKVSKRFPEAGLVHPGKGL